MKRNQAAEQEIEILHLPDGFGQPRCADHVNGRAVKAEAEHHDAQGEKNTPVALIA